MDELPVVMSGIFVLDAPRGRLKQTFYKRRALLDGHEARLYKIINFFAGLSLFFSTFIMPYRPGTLPQSSCGAALAPS
jgi:hypothetical protein